MNKSYRCRESWCTQIYTKKADRDKHHEVMHKNMIPNTIGQFVDYIIKTNPKTKNNAVILVPNFGLYSYDDINLKLKESALKKELNAADTEEIKAIKKAMESVIKTILELDDNRRIKDLWNLDIRIC